MPSRNGDPKPTGPRRQSARFPLIDFLRHNIGYIASVVFIIAIAVAGLFVARSVLQTPNAEEPPKVEEGYVNPFNWENLDRTDGRYRYVVDGEVKSHLGIDVSENQHQIDWQAVASDGIEFAMIRLGYRGATKGDIYLDANYWQNMDGALAAGIDCGVYFFSQADTVDDAVEEANFVLEQLGGLELKYPVAFDSEVVNIAGEDSPTAHLSKDEMTAIADAFCKRIEEAGYRTILYGNAIDLARYHSEVLMSDPVWWAEYNAPVPSARLDLVMWQYANNGQVAGIPTIVDMNIDLSGAL